MNVKNIFIALVFLGVVGLALTGMFRTTAPEVGTAELVNEVNPVADTSAEESEGVPGLDEQGVGTGAATPLNLENSSEETSTYEPIMDEQGAVTVEIIPLNFHNPSETLDFEIVLNTHSIDLSMNLATLATLTTDTGKVIQAISWDAPLGGHHVSGTLSFPAEVEGNPVLEGVSQVTLTIVNVDAPERIFTWER